MPTVWRSHVGRSRYSVRKRRKTRRLKSVDRSRYLTRRTRFRCCRSAPYRKKKKIKFMCGSHHVGSFTHCRSGSKRFSTPNQTICATTIWFGSTLTFLIGSRSTRQAKERPFSHVTVTIGQLPVVKPRRQIQAKFAASLTRCKVS